MAVKNDPNVKRTVPLVTGKPSRVRETERAEAPKAAPAKAVAEAKADAAKLAQTVGRTAGRFATGAFGDVKAYTDKIKGAAAPVVTFVETFFRELQGMSRAEAGETLAACTKDVCKRDVDFQNRGGK